MLQRRPAAGRSRSPSHARAARSGYKRPLPAGGGGLLPIRPAVRGLSGSGAGPPRLLKDARRCTHSRCRTCWLLQPGWHPLLQVLPPASEPGLPPGGSGLLGGGLTRGGLQELCSATAPSFDSWLVLVLMLGHQMLRPPAAAADGVLLLLAATPVAAAVLQVALRRGAGRLQAGVPSAGLSVGRHSSRAVGQAQAQARARARGRAGAGAAALMRPTGFACCPAGPAAPAPRPRCS
jgi:hypothetical protein